MQAGNLWQFLMRKSKVNKKDISNRNYPESLIVFNNYKSVQYLHLKEILKHSIAKIYSEFARPNILVTAQNE